MCIWMELALTRHWIVIQMLEDKHQYLSKKVLEVVGCKLDKILTTIVGSKSEIIYKCSISLKT